MINFSKQGISTAATFYLSENTLFGRDMWDQSQSFKYDPGSTIVACGIKFGGSWDGGFEYEGIKNSVSNLGSSHIAVPLQAEFEDYGYAVSHEALRALLDSVYELGGFQKVWRGTVKWPEDAKPGVMARGTALVVGGLVGRGYGVVFKTAKVGGHTAYFDFGVRTNGSLAGGDVPQKVQDDWKAIVKKPVEDGAVDEGVAPIEAEE